MYCYQLKYPYQLLFSLIIFSLLGFSFSVQAAETPLAYQNTLSEYKKALQTALVSGMSEGVVEAISVCSVQAPEIAQSLSEGEILVGRTSHRLRNPENASPDWVEPILNSYIADASDREPQQVSLADGRQGYVEPILLQPVCTNCHGESLTDDVAMQISQLYPQDQATGFKVGDLRGVFWVEFPADE